MVVLEVSALLSRKVLVSIMAVQECVCRRRGQSRGVLEGGFVVRKQGAQGILKLPEN